LKGAEKKKKRGKARADKGFVCRLAGEGESTGFRNWLKNEGRKSEKRLDIVEPREGGGRGGIIKRR